jgi:hypothetical protein
MSHELNTITFTVARVSAYPEGITIGEVNNYISENGEVVFQGVGIADALAYVTNAGFQRSAIFFEGAQGAMSMTRKVFIAWATRMNGLVNA